MHSWDSVYVIYVWARLLVTPWKNVFFFLLFFKNEEKKAKLIMAAPTTITLQIKHFEFHTFFSSSKDEMQMAFRIGSKFLCHLVLDCKVFLMAILFSLHLWIIFLVRSFAMTWLSRWSFSVFPSHSEFSNRCYLAADSVS